MHIEWYILQVQVIFVFRFFNQALGQLRTRIAAATTHYSQSLAERVTSVRKVWPQLTSAHVIEILYRESALLSHIMEWLSRPDVKCSNSPI